jgi:hypothetical protein
VSVKIVLLATDVPGNRLRTNVTHKYVSTYDDLLKKKKSTYDDSCKGKTGKCDELSIKRQ